MSVINLFKHLKINTTLVCYINTTLIVIYVINRLENVMFEMVIDGS